VRLLLDHQFSPVIAERLRERGHGVDAAVERDLHHQLDEVLLALLATEPRALLTNDVRHLTTIARDWAATGRRHGGLVFTSDARLPRHRGTIGNDVERLAALLAAHPSDDALVERIVWLA